MKTNVSQYDFTEAFRAIRPDNFSYDGLKALFEYLEQWGEDTGEEVELDVIALCCEFTEYENLAEFQDNYGKEDYPDIESINDSTMFIPVYDYDDNLQDNFIVANF